MDLLFEYNADGVDAKKRGDYETALMCYEKARILDPTDIRSYGNSFRILIGLGHYESALRKLLTIIHINRVSGLIGAQSLTLDYKLTIAQNMLEIKSTEQYLMSRKIIGFDYSAERIENIIEKDYLLTDLIYRANNLTFYLGLCYLGINKNLLNLCHIPEEEFSLTKRSLLGIYQGASLRHHPSFGLILFIGFVFSDKNIKRHINSINVVAEWFENLNNKLDFNLSKN